MSNLAVSVRNSGTGGGKNARESPSSGYDSMSQTRYADDL